MPETLDDLLHQRRPSPQRPLLGLMILVVDDSRFTCETLRLMCHRSGARIRRAESLASARRHLAAYRPSIAVIDVGLPDGSGLDLVAELADVEGRIDGIIVLSGDPLHQDDALNAGADVFLAKPIRSLEAFQKMILGHLPQNFGPEPAATDHDEVDPDIIALRDDLTELADLLRSDGAEVRRDYVSAHLQGLGQSARDDELVRLAGLNVPEAELARLVETRRDLLSPAQLT